MVLMIVIVPKHALAQTRTAPPGVHPESGKVGAIKKHTPGQTFVLVGAGDIAGCKNLEGAKATAKLIDQIPGTVFAAGDLAYERDDRRIRGPEARTEACNTEYGAIGSHQASRPFRCGCADLD